MNTFLMALLVEIIANTIIFILTVLVISFLVGNFIDREFRDLKHFLGLYGKKKKITIFFSRLESSDDTKKASRIYAQEFTQVTSILHNMLGGSRNERGFIRKFLDDIIFSISSRNNFLNSKEIEVDYRFSEDAEADIEIAERDGAIICIGGPKYNNVTKYYQEYSEKFLIDKSEAQSCSISLFQDKHKSANMIRAKGKDIGILARLVTKKENVVIIAAGVGVNGTCTAMQCLRDDWREHVKLVESKRIDLPRFQYCMLIECDHYSTGDKDNGDVNDYGYRRNVRKFFPVGRDEKGELVLSLPELRRYEDLGLYKKGRERNLMSKFLNSLGF
ncbi:MAG: hypothetical protein AAFY41_06465 [Bacteroidota bacterium]